MAAAHPAARAAQRKRSASGAAAEQLRVGFVASASGRRAGCGSAAGRGRARALRSLRVRGSQLRGMGLARLRVVLIHSVTWAPSARCSGIILHTHFRAFCTHAQGWPCTLFLPFHAVRAWAHTALHGGVRGHPFLRISAFCTFIPSAINYALRAFA